MAIKPLNSVAGFSVGETPNVVIYGNGDVTTNNITTTGVANLNNIANVTILGGTSGQVIQTDGSGALSFVTIDTWRIQNGNSNVQVLANSNVTITVSGNANIATFTSTGANISGYLTVDGNITANGNLSANNYLVTPSSKDLIIAPATSLIRSYANINPYNDLAYDLGNGLARWGNIYANNSNLTGNLAVTDTANVGNLRTNNLLYANGQPWDLQEAAGSNTQVQFNDGNNNFGASANFTFNTATQVLAVNGNVSISNASPTNGLLTDNLYYSNGQPWDLQQAAGSNTQIQFNDGNNNFGASANLTFDFATNKLTVNGNSQFNNADLGNLATANYINVASNTVTNNLTVNNNISGNTANFTNGVIADTITGNTTVSAGNLNVVNNVISNLIPNVTATYDLGNSSTTWGNIYAANFIGNVSGNIAAPGANTQILFNDANIANAVANFTYDKTYNSNGGQLNVGNTVGGQIITDSFYTAYANVNGNLDVTGNANVTGNIAGNNITASGNISTTGSGGDITMTGGNITGVNNISANSANFTANVIANNLTVNLEISGNTANFTGNIKSLNADLGNLATANYVNVANDINVLGNVVASNFVGALANGNSNVKVYGNANVEVTIGGNANVATFASTGLYVVGEINTTAGNMLSNGNITANGFLNAPNANVTGQVQAGSVLTANITAPSGNISISAAGVDQNILLNPTGNGTVDVVLHRITQVGDPVDPHDAPTKEYVDNVAQGLSVHPAVDVTSATNLNATYLDGGTALTTTTISGNKTITFSTNHGLSIGDEIYWSSSFNGIVAYNSYFVYSTPALNQITVKDGFYGAEVTTLTNGTGLTQPALANSGVGATLTNAGANVAIQIDGISLSSTQRVLVQGQTNAYENGVYVVTTVGNGSTAWVLTRSSDTNTYDPKSTTGLAIGDYFFVQQGNNYAGSSYVLTTPAGEIIFGYTNIGFTQFSAAGSYTAGSGIAITGTTISANVDLVTTDIVSGNIVVKAGANLTTPNLGDATFSSLSWNTLSNGNVSANNLSTGNIANIGTDLTVGNSIVANGNISSNATINGNNLFITNFANVQGNILGDNVTANHNVYTSNANISSNLITNNATVNLNLSGNTANFSSNVIMSNATVNLALSGNTANFSGNVIVPNLTVNLTLSGNVANFSGNVVANQLTVNNNIAGNTANFTGNISAANANLGNLVTANYFTGTLANGTSNIEVLNNGNINLTAGGNTTLVVTDTGANITGNLDVTGNFNVGALVANTLTANNSVFVGNTEITWANVTTISTTANQTISSYTLTGTNVTGVQWLVKAIDNNLSNPKYSVATVQAVTDGTTVDYTTFGTVQLGGYTGSLAVNIVGSTIRLQVTPASSNSTVWTTQYRLI